MAGYDGTQLKGALGGLFKGEAIRRSMLQDLANLEQTRASTDQLRQKMGFEAELQPALLKSKELANKTTELQQEGTVIDNDRKKLDMAGVMQQQDKEDMAQFAERQKQLAIEVSELPPGMQWDYAKEALSNNPKSQHFYDSLLAANQQGMIPKNKDGSTPTLSQILTRMSDATIQSSMKWKLQEMESKQAGIIEGMRTERAMAVENLQGANAMKVAQFKAGVDRQIAQMRINAEKQGQDTAKTFEQNANKYFDLAMKETDPEKRALLLQAANQFKEAAVQVRPASDQKQAVLGENGIEYVNRKPQPTPFQMPGAQAPAAGPVQQAAPSTAPVTTQAPTQNQPGQPAQGKQRYEAKSGAEAKALMGKAQSGDVIIYNGKAYTKP